MMAVMPSRLENIDKKDDRIVKDIDIPYIFTKFEKFSYFFCFLMIVTLTCCLEQVHDKFQIKLYRDEFFQNS